MRMRILTRQGISLANYRHQISNKKLRIRRCEGIRQRMRMALRKKRHIFILAAEIPCQWMFATKFASDCECDGVVHSGRGGLSVRVVAGTTMLSKCPPSTECSEDAMGGVEKRGGVENLTNDRGFGTPLVRYVFHPPQASVLCFSCTKIHDRVDQKLFWRGPKVFGRARSLVRFPPPIPFAPPHITAQSLERRYGYNPLCSHSSRCLEVLV